MKLLSQVDIGDVFTPGQKFQTVGDLVSLVSKLAALGGSLLIIATIVYAAYWYLTAQGDAKNIEKAKTAITYSLIGAAVIATAYWITQIMARFLGTSF